MGRWDALKPDDDSKDGGEWSSSSKSSRQSHRATNASSAAKPRSNTPTVDASSPPFEWKPRKQQGWTNTAVASTGSASTTTATSTRRTTREDQTALTLSLLTDQLQYYRSKSELFDQTKVQKALEEIKIISPRSLSLLVLVDLLEIDQAMIQTAAWQRIDERLNQVVSSSQLMALDKDEAADCIEKLAKYYYARAANEEYASTAIDCLGRIVSSQVKELPAEETAQNVVGPILLRALNDVPSGGEEATQISVCESMDKILSNSRFASAILAPLVQDVSTDGKEQTVTNPLRKDLFRSLQNILFSESRSVLLRAKACSTLASTIETLRKTDETSNTDLDQPNLEQFLATNLDHTLPLYRPSLILLRVVLRMYPNAVTKLCSRLLFPDRSMSGGGGGSHRDRPCSHCACRVSGLSSFFASVHSSITTESSGLAFDCVTELIDALPLDRWLLKRQPHGRNPVSGFYRKVVHSLAQLVSIARCAVLQKGGAVWEESLGRLCTKCFVAIPWDDESLEKEGESFWSILASSFQNPGTSSISRTSISTVLISGMGGRVTPQGDLPPMSLPARRWLSREESGLPFVESIFQSIRKNDEDSQSLDLFCAMLRTRPETALPLWPDYEKMLRDLTRGDSKRRGIGLRIVESFLLGRKDFPSDQLGSLEENHAISELAFSVLECTKADNNGKNHCRALSSYAALVQEDWEYLGLDNARFLMVHVDGLLHYCTGSKADVRRAGCKAVGEFCSQYFTEKNLSGLPNNTTTDTVVRQICSIMLNVLKEDDNAAARSMAIFALGNLALAMNEHDAMDLLAATTVVDISNAILAGMSDSNDKVAGNAIRSIGHWGHILARLNGRQSEAGLSESLLGVLDGLSERVARALALASREQQSNMSWKERSAAKKHGWGACHSLGRILDSITELSQSSLEQALFRAVEQLVQCLNQATLLSEKVVLAAMAALRALKPLQLVGVTGKSGLIGDCLAYCCLLLFSKDCTITRFVEERSLLLSHLLSCASISDVTAVLKQEQISKSMLESLYRWMVDHEMEGRAFEIFALGLQRPGLAASPDVSLEQRFASRALWQYKKEQSISLNSDEEDDIDGGDEL